MYLEKQIQPPEYLAFEGEAEYLEVILRNNSISDAQNWWSLNSANTSTRKTKWNS